MSSFQGLTLNGKYYSKPWILDCYESLDPKQFTENEIKTLLFCGQWLSGVREFAVQTSGSTGEPKIIRLNRPQMALSARMTGQALKLTRGDRALVCLSPTYIGGLMMLARGLELDLDLTVIEPLGNPFESLKLQESSKTDSLQHFDFTALVPLPLQTILSSGSKYISLLNKTKAILVGGASVSSALQKKIQAVEAPIYHTFGMTETVSHIALRRLNGPEASESFKPLAGVEIGTDERGCLTVKSPLTGDRLLVTNDLVEIKPDRSFVWLGRIDHVINTGGVKVQAEKVERALEETLHEIDQGRFADREFFVGPLPDEKYGQVVTVIFEAPEFPPEIQNKIRNKLCQKLTRYEVPKQFCFVDSFLRTSTGKIDRRSNLKKLVNSN
jgi:O-succinylbenzoic acid--CoA ligase